MNICFLKVSVLSERVVVLFACLVLACVAMSCAGMGRKGLPGEEAAAPRELVLATVDGERITEADFLRALGRVPAAYREKYSTPDGKRQLLNSLIEDEIFYKEGRKIGIDRAADVEAEVSDFRKRIVRDRVSDELTGQVMISDEEIEKYYRENLEKYTVPEKLRLSIIMIALARDAKPEKVEEAEKKALDIIERLSGGEEFEWLAAQLSDHASGKDGGDLGFQAIEDLPPDIVKEALGLPSVGDVGGPVSGDLGIYIIKFAGLQPETIVPIEEARGDIEGTLWKKAHDEAYRSLLERLEEEADIEVDDAALERMALKKEGSK